MLIMIIVISIFCTIAYAGKPVKSSNVKTGTASYYSNKFNGRRTSSGEIFNNKHYTAAHPFLPFGTFVLVTNLNNEKSVVVKINDRFKPKKDHILDITKAAAKEIDLLRYGMAKISMEVIADTTVTDFVLTDSIPIDMVTYKLYAGRIQLFDQPSKPVHTIKVSLN
jgi:rare lipoprotein A